MRGDQEAGFELPYRELSPAYSLVRSVIRTARRGALAATSRGRLTTGHDVVIGAKAVIRSPSRAAVGDRVAIGREFFADVDFEIGNDVLVSSRVAFVGNDHRFEDPTSTVFANGRHTSRTVVVEGDNLIGFGAVIVGSVSIGQGCIVGAGAVVVSDLPPYTVCTGVPARVIRQRFAGGTNDPELDQSDGR